MSKEKNLVTYDLRGSVAVDGHGHAWIEDHNCMLNDIFINPRLYITGPAIDRLHEFEKLGMEPEEIKEILNSNLVRALSENIKLKADVDRRDKAIDGQNDYIRELKEKIKNQDAVIEQLRTMNQKQFDNLKECQTAIDNKDELINFQREHIEKLAIKLEKVKRYILEE